MRVWWNGGAGKLFKFIERGKEGGVGGGMLLPYHSSSLNCEIIPPSTIPHRKVDIKKYFYRIIILSLFLL